jgi:D-alanyl-lipoteichoic acid acyltransferase DltB (MBOAT superfamily)
MSLISLQFGVFFIVTLTIYYLVPLKFRWCALLAASAVFYLLSASHYTLLYLVFSIVSIYLASRYIARESSKYKNPVYVLAISANITLLVLLKYIGGLSSTGSTLLRFFGIHLPQLELGWIASLGISFYTLQLIGYLTDVYWTICPAQKNIAKLALFASYFPSLSSGPILRYGQVESELFTGHKASYKNITFGLQRMLWGLFKKMIIAERMAAIAHPIFTDMDVYSGIWLWIGLVAAVLQMYADFSGNMDFILGASECFGVKLPENFLQPFSSLTIQEFWQRWHISLGNWLRDYIMYPLLRSKMCVRFGKFAKKHFGKKASKIVPTFFAMFVLWFANGIWHGGYLKYMATAMWFWFAVTARQLLEPVGEKIVRFLKINIDCFSWRLFQRVRTFALYSFGVLFFYAPSISHALGIIKRMPNIHNIFDLFDSNNFFSDTAFKLFENKLNIHVLLISLSILFCVDSYKNRGGRIRENLAEQNLVFRWIVLFALIFSILLFGVYGPGYNPADFIYAGF